METKQNDDLAKIYDYFGLNSALDGRLIVKANIMKKTIFYCMQWKEGYEKEWIDKIAIRTCVSTRKIREDYLQPLVTDGILQRFAHGQIRFIGLNDGVLISQETYNGNTCRNCGKPVRNNLNFCNEVCAKQYSNKKKAK